MCHTNQYQSGSQRYSILLKACSLHCCWVSRTEKLQNVSIIQTEILYYQHSPIPKNSYKDLIDMCIPFACYKKKFLHMEQILNPYNYARESSQIFRTVWSSYKQLKRLVPQFKCWEMWSKILIILYLLSEKYESLHVLVLIERTQIAVPVNTSIKE